MNSISFLSAGWETSTLTLANAMWFLTSWSLFPKSERLQHRLRQEAAEGRPELFRGVVRETLRWRPPVPWHGGVVADGLDVSVNGSEYRIPKGTQVIVDILGANSISA